jgi:hypothetical protein
MPLVYPAWQRKIRELGFMTAVKPASSVFSEGTWWKLTAIFAKNVTMAAPNDNDPQSTTPGLPELSFDLGVCRLTALSL